MANIHTDSAFIMIYLLFFRKIAGSVIKKMLLWISGKWYTVPGRQVYNSQETLTGPFSAARACTGMCCRLAAERKGVSFVYFNRGFDNAKDCKVCTLTVFIRSL
jgi:hypothetical protein